MSKISATLHAEAGDRVVIRGRHVGAPERDAEVLEALGEDGGPPFLVRWKDDGHVSRLYPSSDAHVEHLAGADPKPPSMAEEWEAAVPPADS